MLSFIHCFGKKKTNIGCPPIIVWENQIYAAYFVYVASPYISKTGCFLNTGICTNLRNSALRAIHKKDHCQTMQIYPAGEVCAWRRGDDPYGLLIFPPRFASREQIGDAINLSVAHSIAEPSACKSFINPTGPPSWAMPCSLLLTVLFLRGKRNPTWGRTLQGLPQTGTCMRSVLAVITAAGVGAPSWPSIPHAGFREKPNNGALYLTPRVLWEMERRQMDFMLQRKECYTLR